MKIEDRINEYRPEEIRKYNKWYAVRPGSISVRFQE